MTINHKIILGYIKDLSVETPDPESLIAARENISKYSLKIDLSSKILKNKSNINPNPGFIIGFMQSNSGDVNFIFITR